MNLFSTFASLKTLFMDISEVTQQQIDRAIRKIVEKFPSSQEASVLTDIHLCVSQETGELLALDDDDKEITRCVVEQWIEAKDDDFYEQVAQTLRKTLGAFAQQIDNMSILKPYAFVLENEDRDEQQELYVVDDETVIIDPVLMRDLDQDLDSFFENLMKDI
jgi:hypothetical protein